MSWIKEIGQEISAIQPKTRDLRQFGLVMLIALGLIGGLLFWKGRTFGLYLAGLGLLLEIWSLVWPRGIQPLYRFWMGLAVVLGFFVSKILLTILFYCMITPIGLILKLLGRDLLDMKFKDRNSYWHQRAPEDYRQEQSEKMY